MSPSLHSRRSVLAAAAALLAGCGGGPAGDASGDGTPSPPPTTASTPTEQPTPTESADDRPPFTHWTYETPHDALGSLTLAPGAGGPAVYATSAQRGAGDGDHAVTAISLPDGTEQWRVSLPNPPNRPPTYGGDDGPDRLYVATSEVSLHGRGALVHAIDPTRGEEAWRFDAEERGFLRPLAATDGAAFVGTADDVREGGGETVYSLAAGDGTERWRAGSGDADPAGSLVRRGTVVVEDPGGLRAFDPATGDPRWEHRVETGVDGPAYDNRGERVFLGADGDVLALSLADGAELWRRAFDFTLGAVTSPRQALSDTVFVADYDGRLLALSPLDGTTRWTIPVEADQFTFPTVQRTSETLFVDAAPGVLALDPVSGEERWSFAPDVEGTIRAHASTTVFASGGRDERVWALDPETGEVRWTYAPGTDIAGPTTAGDLAVVGVGGTVLALDGSGGG